MAKPSVSEPSATPQPSARDSHGNQSHGSDATASASREIFQGLFKDLGKQAMAMESILRLVCGKVDKLEHWVTEMSFGMTELDLKLRNIAHNIEGTAGNVDDVDSVNRWAVPVEDDPADVKAATATVIKKVGVGLHKKKQMRMTGMVANILDQLTTVAETSSMVESESEAHKSEDGGKKKKGKKAKDREKAKARGEHATDSGGVGETVLLSKENSPRETEPKSEVKEKHKTHKKEKADPQEHAQPLEEAVDEKPQEQVVVTGDDKAGKAGEENVLEHEELKVDEKSHEDAKVHERRDDEDFKEVAHEDVKEDNTEEKAKQEEEATPEQEAQEEEVGVVVGESKEEETSGVGVQEDVAGEREPEKPVETERIAEYAEEVRVTEVGETVELAKTEEQQAEAQKSDPEKVELPAQSHQPSAREEPANQPQPSAELEATQVTMATPSTQVFPATDAVSSSGPSLDDKPIQPMATNSAEPAQTTTSLGPLESVQSLPVEQTPSRLLSPIPSSRAPVDDAVVSIAASPPQPTPAPQQSATPAIRPDLPTIRLEPLAIQEVAPPLKTTPPALAESNTPVPVETPPAASSEHVRPPELLTKASSKRLRNKNAPTSTEEIAETGGRSSPTKRGSRKASIRRSISQRQPSLKKQRSPIPPPEPQVSTEDTKPVPTLSSIQPSVNAVLKKPSTMEIPPANATSGVQHNDRGQEEGSQEEDEDDDDDDDDDDDSSSMLSSDSDGSVLDLGASGGSGAAEASAATNATTAGKKMSSKMTRTLTALNKLQKANVLSPDEIAELKQRATQKWFRLRDHVKEKNKKDVTNILLKRKKNIFTVSNRIELLEEKSREVYASIKQLNTELKSKLEASSFESLRRHVHDIHASLQVLDQKISKGDIPTMEHIKQLATEAENLRLMFLEQLAFARDHCDANHDETLKMFEDEWKRVAAIEKSMEEKLETLATGFDAKILALPDYADALEGIRRAIRKKADLKMLRELEAKLLGHDGESEDCLVRCLSCHKEVTNTGGHDATNNEDNDVSVANSPHFKRVNPGTASAKVYRSNMPLSAHPLVISESTPELFSTPQTDEATTPNAKSVTPSRRATRNEEPRPSPLSFIHVTATRAMAAAADAGRPISAPSVAIKKKTQPTTTK